MAWLPLSLLTVVACYSADSGDGDDVRGGDGDSDVDVDIDADGDADPVPCDEWTPTTWTVEALASAAAFAANLVVDSSGVGHATFMTWGDESKYARYENGEWRVETAFRGGHPGTGIAVDGEGTVHFAAGRYIPGGPGNQTLFHVSNPGAQWSTEEIGVGYTGVAFSLGRDGVAGLAYGGPQGELLVSSNASGTWTETLVDPDGDACCDNLALVVDARGSLHVAYYATLRELRYATDSSGEWEIVMVGFSDYGGAGWLHPRLILDSDGRAHIAYERPGVIVTAIVDGGVVVDEAPHALGLDEGTVVAFAFELPNVVHVAGVGVRDPRAVLRYAADRLGAFDWMDVAGVEEFFSPPLLVTDRRSSPWILYTAVTQEGQSVIAAVPDGAWCR